MKKNSKRWKKSYYQAGNILLFSAVLAGPIVLTSCSQSGRKNQGTSREDVKKEFLEAADTAEAYMNQEKEALLASFEARLSLARAQIRDYNAMVSEAGENIKAEYQQRIEFLDSAALATEQKMDNMVSSSESAWNELKEGLELALEDLEQAIHDARDELKGSESD